MSLISNLVQTPFTMRPGLSRAASHQLTLESSDQQVKKLKQLGNPIIYQSVGEELKAQTLQALTKYLPICKTPDSLEELSALVREDIVVMNSQGIFELLYVNYPSGWAPEEHLHKTFDEVHKRLPDAELIQRASSHFVKLVIGGDIWRRAVWTLSPTDDLCRHPKITAAQKTWDETPRVYFRWEEQTFLPLVPGKQVIFLIKVQTKPLSEAFETMDDLILLSQSLSSMTPAVRAYKGLDHPRVSALVVQAMAASKF